MKLAEALQARADIHRKLDQLSTRLDNNVLTQEGVNPNEDPNRLKQEMEQACERLTYLMEHINLTNNQTMIDGQSLTALIAKKDGLTIRLSHLRSALDVASRSTYRARASEIKILPTINVVSWQKECDDLAKTIRQLDNTLQQANWTTDLIE